MEDNSGNIDDWLTVHLGSSPTWWTKFLFIYI